jgi:tRNA (adenine57-N1/adenine58-N1)-methyltransferase catalytic subunit
MRSYSITLRHWAAAKFAPLHDWNPPSCGDALTEDIDKPAKRAQPGDLALLVGQDRKSFLVRLKAGLQFHTHRGIVAHDDLIGSPWGCQLSTHLGHTLLLLKPSTDDIVLGHLKRNTQIIYPKESGYILMKMGVKSGCRVIEAGAGSGALTLVLAQAVAPTGRVYSYERRPEMRQLAQENLGQLGLADVVTFKLRDIVEGFDERDVDALFLDVPNPWDYLTQVQTALSGGGFFGALLPTTNQVSRLIGALEERDFGLIEVEELLLRQYKAVPARLRPKDRMVAHTGYLIFARALVSKEE